MREGECLVLSNETILKEVISDGGTSYDTYSCDRTNERSVLKAENDDKYRETGVEVRNAQSEIAFHNRVASFF